MKHNKRLDNQPSSRSYRLFLQTNDGLDSSVVVVLLLHLPHIRYCEIREASLSSITNTALRYSDETSIDLAEL